MLTFLSLSLRERAGVREAASPVLSEPGAVMVKVRACRALTPALSRRERETQAAFALAGLVPC